jgi:sigma-B regulation protein RsbU (phosphoserine phosphatase)
LTSHTNRRLLLYIPLALFAAFAAAAFYSHLADMPARYRQVTYDYRIPFNRGDRVNYVSREGEAAGLKVGDRIVSINGVETPDRQSLAREVDNAGRTGKLDISVIRTGEDGSEQPVELSIALVRLEKDFNFYVRLFVGFLFMYVFPVFSVLLGFWVVLVRPNDFLAWLLLFLLCGIAVIGLEGFDQAPVLSSFKAVCFGTWALAMFLFGLYFPEPVPFDKKLPWLKWLIVVPLGYQIFVVLLDQLKKYTGLGFVELFSPINNVYFRFSMPLNMLAIGLFFACLGWKSGTAESPDARRRLRVMMFGTTVSMTPFFILILYSTFSGARGSFYDIAPAWFALLALLLMLLFPLTMAYVIVVQRAMDVRLVIRQGIQYALAKGGVRVLQFILLLGVGLGVRWFINNFGTNLWLQILIIIGGIALVPLIDLVARPLQVWIDKRFFREAYNAEQILLELSEDVRTMVETKPLLETVSTKISESLHVPQVALLLKNNGSFEPAYTLGFDTPPKIALPDGTTSTQTLRKNKHIFIYDEQRETTSTPNVTEDEREQLKELNSQVLLPLAAKNELSGILSLSPKRSEAPYTPNDIRLLKSVAAQTGLALENSRLTESIAHEAAQKERLNREVEIAREVQERLFPQELPPIEGLDYFGACRPALGVGGDYYDFLELPDGKFGIAIGDVSGKGIGASLMMASLQASLRGQAIHCGDDLAKLMKHVNTLVYEASTTNRYATFFYAQLDTRSMRLTYVNAGHNPPFVIRADGQVLKLEDGGAVVGMLPGAFANYDQGEIKLRSGDMLVGYTDGISEAMNPQEEEWGEDAMLAELINSKEKTAAEILPYIVSKADEFANGAKQHDDMTMIVVKVR